MSAALQMPDDASDALARDGRSWFRGALSARSLDTLDALCALDAAPGSRIRLTGLPRDALAPVTTFVRTLLAGAEAVRLVAFDKSEANNWTLPWHQDRVVAVRDRVEAPGFSNWTHKAGIWHAEPPIAFLEQMLFARVHLDATDERNGAMQIALGSHAFGRVPANEAAARAEASTIETCVAERGDVLVASALILHRSSPSQTAALRRALRIDYCAEQLPTPLQWETAS